jgi:hypothetical protein
MTGAAEPPDPIDPPDTQDPAEPADAAEPADPAEPESPGSGWVAPGPAEPSAPSRAMLVFAWILAVAVLVVVGFLAYRATLGTDAFRFGAALGAIAVPIIVAVVLRWIVVRSRPAAGRRIMGSPWVPLTILLVAAFVGARSIAALAPPPAVDPASAVRISAPWQFESSEAETVSALETQARNDRTIRAATARHLIGPNGESAFLLVVDGAFRDDPKVIEEVARNMTDTSTTETSLETIGGVQVALTDGAAATVLTWIEPPLGLVVVSADAATGRQIVESILAGSAPSPTP